MMQHCVVHQVEKSIHTSTRRPIITTFDFKRNVRRSQKVFNMTGMVHNKIKHRHVSNLARNVARPKYVNRHTLTACFSQWRQKCIHPHTSTSVSLEPGSTASLAAALATVLHARLSGTVSFPRIFAPLVMLGISPSANRSIVHRRCADVRLAWQSKLTATTFAKLILDA